jgi:hypothetical protein
MIGTAVLRALLTINARQTALLRNCNFARQTATLLPKDESWETSTTGKKKTRLRRNEFVHRRKARQFKQSYSSSIHQALSG